MKNCLNFSFFLYLILFWGTDVLAQGLDARENPPNIVIIFADDMGYGDIKALNPLSKIETPALDALAAEGITFSNAHASASVCTPSRFGLLTGEYAFRTPAAARGIGGFTPPVMDTDRMTMATLLQNAGYRTAIVGKWHLGLEWVTKDGKAAVLDVESGHSNVDYSQPVRTGPNDFGFDYSFIHPASLDIPPYVFLENHRTVDPEVILTTDVYPRRKENTEFSWDKKHSNDQAVYWEKGVWWRQGEMAPSFRVEDCLDEITSQGLAFIERQSADTPFFLYVPLTGPHTPWLPSEEHTGKSGAGLYGDFVMDIDQVVARIKQQLHAQGLLENTILIFSSDNGAYWPEEEILLHGHDSNRGVRGQKGDAWDGGHRVPLLLSWPKGIRKKATYPGLVSLTDLFATVAGLLDQKIPAGAALDSYSFLPVVQGDKEYLARTEMVHHSSSGVFAIRTSEWKYIDGLGSGGFSAPTRLKPAKGGPKGQLYRIREDPYERDNLYANYPQVVEELKAQLEGIVDR
ncbi:Arylsulfatase A [Cyclobacterium xiamenense]|uniref:Arylsulfatase A n=1 Tax=Cyclobacterium xiamenense TaxID=1297121 RepID=A0A1H7A9V3_9BACT|nr:arylsulfatase [Cyclobacterium xiamenense]SEJ62351.1 Arylsulfatase A [Cyclobacterium xiamenense]